MAVVAAVATALTLPYAQTAALLVDLGGMHPVWRALLPARVQDVHGADVEVPTRAGRVPVRVYVPERETRHPVLVFPGVHTGGLDEPRLSRLSARLAATGAIVVSAPLPGLRHFEITPAATDTIEDIAAWAADAPAVGRGRRVGLIGVSFAGGLAIVAAGRPSLADRLTAVVSIGGHGDLPRVLRFLATGELPGHGHRAPNDYAVAVLLVSVADRLVPPAQVDDLRTAMLAFLDAATAVDSQPGVAPALFANVSAFAATLPDPAGAVMRDILERRTTAIDRRVLPWLDELGTDPALSPERSPLPTVPMFLIHGAHDAVIPSVEMNLLASHARAAGARVHQLETPYLTHATVDGDLPVGDALTIVRFWTRVMAALR